MCVCNLNETAKPMHMNHPAQTFFSPYILTIDVFGCNKHNSILYVKLISFSDSNKFRHIGLKIGFKMTYGNCFDFFSFPLDLCLLVVGDYEEVVAVEFSGGCDEGVELALAGFPGCHVVAYL